MNIRAKAAAIALGVLGFACVVPAHEEAEPAFGSFGGSLTLATDYMFRGISNSNNRPQVQGDFNWSHGSGVYAGVWASNTDFGGPGNSMEIDPYLGFADVIGDTGLSYDVGAWSYNYPGSRSDFDYTEYYVILTRAAGDLSISPSLWYTDNYFGDDFLEDVNGFAYDITVAYDLPRQFSVSARVGEQTFGSGTGELDYVYYDVAVAKDWRDFTVKLGWYDTDGIDPQLADPDLGDGEAVLSLTRTF